MADFIGLFGQPKSGRLLGRITPIHRRLSLGHGGGQIVDTAYQAQGGGSAALRNFRRIAPRPLTRSANPARLGAVMASRGLARPPDRVDFNFRRARCGIIYRLRCRNLGARNRNKINHHDTTTLRHYDTTTLRHYDTTTLRHYEKKERDQRQRHEVTLAMFSERSFLVCLRGSGTSVCRGVVVPWWFLTHLCFRAGSGRASPELQGGGCLRAYGSSSKHKKTITAGSFAGRLASQRIAARMPPSSTSFLALLAFCLANIARQGFLRCGVWEVIFPSASGELGGACVWPG